MINLLFLLLLTGTSSLEVTVISADSVVRRADLIEWTGAEKVEVNRARLESPWQGSLHFDRALTEVQLEIRSSESWAAPIALEKDQASLQIELFPRSELIFQVEETAPAQRELTVIVEGNAAPGEKPGQADKLKKTQFNCSRDQARWRCPVPAMPLDLRLSLAGHVPQYFWNMTFEPGKAYDLGRVRFQKGASITGWITTDSGELSGARVQLERIGILQNPRDGQRSNLQRLETAATERGFFQIAGVAPGGYRVTACRKELACREVSPVIVEEEVEVALAQPLHLGRPAILEVNLSPLLSPSGKPWQVVLQKALAGHDAFEREDVGFADSDGHWKSKSLDPGAYFLEVRSPDGQKTGSGEDSAWLFQPVEVNAGMPPLFLEISLVAVTGQLLAGETPLHGRLFFGGFHGMPNITMIVDEEGHFEGGLPHEGLWRLDAEVGSQVLTLPAVEVELNGQRAARLTIQLPGSRFFGRVVKDGQPVAGAMIQGLSVSPEKFGQFRAESNEEGRFDVRGIEPSRYAVLATYQRASTPWLEFQIEEKDPDQIAEVELVVEEMVEVSGQVNNALHAVPGSAISYFPRSGEGSLIGKTVWTDGSGAFRLWIPASTTAIDFLVMAPGFAWQIVRRMSQSPAGGQFAPILLEVAPGGQDLQIEDGVSNFALLIGDRAVIPLGTVRREAARLGLVEAIAGGQRIKNAASATYSLCGPEGCRAALPIGPGALGFSPLPPGTEQTP